MALSQSREVADPAPRDAISGAIVRFVSSVPQSDEPARPAPAARARELAHSAAIKTALAAGGLALPPGPLGWLTILPELTAVWRIQAQLVADIAALYGASATLTREHMLYCLFRHTAAQAFRDLVVRAGERLVVRRVSAGALQALARSVGLNLTQRALGRGVTRLVPLVGAAGVGAYAYFDTRQVARTAIGLFERGVQADSGDSTR
ncbi:MAG TPA: EcsC family protein [Burkholderiaceae bacterium]